MDIDFRHSRVLETEQREARMVTCPMKDKNYNGYCENCSERTSCMLQEVLERLRELEEAIRRMNTAQAIQG